MSTFTDALGQEWSIEFDAFLLDRIKRDTEIDLADNAASGLLAVERDVTAMVKVLLVACDDQIKAKRKPPAEFQKQIRKDAITRARGALMEALADFFPESEWSAMLSSLTTRKNQPDISPEQLQLAAGFLKMDPEVQRDVMGLIREEMAGGNSPYSPDEDSASGPGADPPPPAGDLRESAESTQEDLPSETSGSWQSLPASRGGP